DTAPPAAYRILCLRFDHLVHRVSTAPPWTQDSIRVGGSPLPDRDSHPARDAKLFLARERLAHHALRGELWAKALAYCRQAGEKAIARSAHREAVGYFEQALSTL